MKLKLYSLYILLHLLLFSTQQYLLGNMKMIKILIINMNKTQNNIFKIKIQREVESHNRIFIYIQQMLIVFSLCAWDTKFNQ